MDRLEIGEERLEHLEQRTWHIAEQLDRTQLGLPVFTEDELSQINQAAHEDEVP